MEYVKVTFPTNRLVYIDGEKNGTVQEGAWRKRVSEQVAVNRRAPFLRMP
jgi:hypothetical protein